MSSSSKEEGSDETVPELRETCRGELVTEVKDPIERTQAISRA